MSYFEVVITAATNNSIFWNKGCAVQQNSTDVSENIPPLSSESKTSLLPSFLSALQLRVNFGLLNNQPPFLSVPHSFICSDDETSNGRMKK
jgi:hypothetical protein